MRVFGWAKGGRLVSDCIAVGSAGAEWGEHRKERRRGSMRVWFRWKQCRKRRAGREDEERTRLVRAAGGGLLRGLPSGGADAGA